MQVCPRKYNQKCWSCSTPASFILLGISDTATVQQLPCDHEGKEIQRPRSVIAVICLHISCCLRKKHPYFHMNVNVSVIYTQILILKKISCIKRLKFGDKLTFQQMVSCTFSLSSWGHCERKNGLLYYKYEEPVNCSSDTLLCHSKANVPFWVIPARTANSLSFYSPLILICFHFLFVFLFLFMC